MIEKVFSHRKSTIAHHGCLIPMMIYIDVEKIKNKINRVDFLTGVEISLLLEFCFNV